jgi:hypothetical protein
MIGFSGMDRCGRKPGLSILMVGRAVTHDCWEVSEWDTTGGAELEKNVQGKKGGEGWKLMEASSRLKGKVEGLNLDKIESGELLRMENEEIRIGGGGGGETGKEKMEIVGGCLNNSKAILQVSTLTR